MDSSLKFPHFSVLKASAGSGKTYALSRRFLQFLLSDRIEGNSLANILAITFSNNAAKEMKERILTLLKSISLGDKGTMKEFSCALSMSEAVLEARASESIEEILSNFGDFQIRTIDSFTTSIFRSSAIDFGYSPDFEIVMNNAALLEHAFAFFMRKVREGSRESRIVSDVVDFMMTYLPKDAPFPWEPSEIILRELGNIYRLLASSDKPLRINDYSSDLKETEGHIRETIESIEGRIARSKLSRNKRSSFESMLNSVRLCHFRDLIDRGMKTPPVKKPGVNQDADAYSDIISQWRELSRFIATFTQLFASAYYTPYIRAYEGFSGILERIKRQEGKVFIEDINARLADYISEDVVPDIYLRLGETIFHYLIDEFQDTSPIQWKNLYPLLENSLSQGGSLFVVGDTKQAIYGFRDADYRIMMSAEKSNPFPSAHHEVDELGTNYRSEGNIVSFAKKVFQTVLPTREECVNAAAATGLLDYQQTAKPERREHGYVRACILPRKDDEEPEREKIYETIDGLLSRGYRYHDIAILGQRNNDVLKATGWLNARKIPFVSFSSLDVRTRKITGEIIHLLQFLDSPVDDLALATFLFGDIFSRALISESEGTTLDDIHALCFKNHVIRKGPLYRSLLEDMQRIWLRYFDKLFRLSGYLPLYDLVSEVYSDFRVFQLFGAQEEAVLAKLLDVIQNLEAEGGGGLRNFLSHAQNDGESDSEWSIDIPPAIEAVKVMTIHKSKGLGFPAVILLLYGETNKGFSYILKKKSEFVELLRLTKDMVSADDEFGRLYREERTKEMVNRLNSLYVAFTRAEKELHIIGAKRERDSLPFALLPCDTEYSQGRPDQIESQEKEQPDGDHAVHCAIRPSVGAESPQGSLKFEEKKRGEAVHKLLSSFEYLDDDFDRQLESAAVRIADQTGLGVDDLRRLASRLAHILAAHDLAKYFRSTPGRRILVECELTNEKGHLFRADRIVVESHLVTVIEYKTGGDAGNEVVHSAQMLNYLSLAASLFPRPRIEGLLCYVDTGNIMKFVLP
jgi:ATP-dependent helicase/nuclease subunit A